MPYVVLAVALLLLFAALDVERSLWTIGIAHTVIALPYALLIVVARLAGLDPDLEEAAMDLGASYPTTLRRIVLPLIAPAIVAAWLVAFTASFDEFALALFLAGPEPTLPVYIYGQLRFASRLPLLIALAVMVMAGSLTLALLADRLRRRHLEIVCQVGLRRGAASQATSGAYGGSGPWVGSRLTRTGSPARANTSSKGNTP